MTARPPRSFVSVVGRSVVVALMLALPTVGRSADVEEQAQRLAELRQEVERLSDEIEMSKEDLRGRLRALDGQRAEVEAQIRREELRMRAVADEASRQADALEQDQGSAESLLPAVRETIAGLRTQIAASLPYRTDERLEALDTLEARIEDGTIRPQQAANQLWQTIEDELRLARENSIDRQVIDIDGEQVLCEVARVGMMAAYYRSDDGRIGHAVKQGSEWTWVAYTDPERQQQVALLIDALQKNVRTGWFTLPDVVGG